LDKKTSLRELVREGKGPRPSSISPENLAIKERRLVFFIRFCPNLLLLFKTRSATIPAIWEKKAKPA